MCNNPPVPGGSGTPAPARAGERGGALLMVLWLSAALTAIALAVATTVRSETERTTTSVEGLKAYYLATGAVERAILYIRWGPYHRNPDGSARFYGGGPRMYLTFPTGDAAVDVIPEAAKLNVNSAPPQELMAVLLGVGAAPEQAGEITAGILDWRTQQPPGAVTLFDQFYLARSPSFRARHASFEEIEELLLVKGMTPELFYGGYDRIEGRLIPRPALRDCLSVWGTQGAVDVNSAAPPVLAAVGLPPELVDIIVAARSRAPFRTRQELAAVTGPNTPGAGRLGVGGMSIFTIRATARVRMPDGGLSDTRRSAAVVLKFLDQRKYLDPYHVLRWYDDVWVQ